MFCGETDKKKLLFVIQFVSSLIINTKNEE